MFRIQVLDAEDNLISLFPLGDQPIVIGRDPESTVSLPAANVSRNHAVIEPYGNFFVVKDLGSTNGTWVNRKPITSHILKAGDMIHVGNFRVLVDETNRSVRVTDQKKPFRENEARILESNFDVDESLESGRTFQLKIGNELTAESVDSEIWARVMRLHDVSRDIGLIETPEILYQKVLEIVILELEADRAAILLTQDSGELETTSAISALDDDPDEIFPIHKGVLTAVTTEMSGILTEDVGLDSRFDKEAGGQTGRVYSVLCVPLVARNKLQGAIYLDRVHNVAPFKEEDLRLLTLISGQVSTSLINAALFQGVLLEKEKLRMVIDNLHDGLVLTDSNLKIEKFNEAASKTLGGSLLGRNFLEVIDSRATTLDVESFHEAVSSNTAFQCDVELDSENRSYNIAVGNYRKQGSKDFGILFSLRDTSVLVKLEMMKSEFIRTASHKLRTPLTVLVGNIELLKAELPEQLSEVGESLIEGLDKNLHQLMELVNRFVEFVELDKDSGDYVQVDVDEILTLSWAGLSMRAAEKRIQLVKAYNEDESFEVSGVPQRLVQCFTNIFDNTIKFSPERSVVTVDILPDEENYNIHIRDEGPGIPKEKLPLIFTSFQQVEAVPTGEVQGVGLGLTIAKRVLHNHKASIRVESPSRSGKGTEFIVAFSKNPLQPDRMEYVETDMIPFVS